MVNDTKILGLDTETPNRALDKTAEPPEKDAPKEGTLPECKPHYQRAFEGTRYQIVSLLGRGGMAMVYKALDSERDHEPVALKVLSSRDSTDPTAVQRFQRELDTLQKCDHENIVKIYDCGINRLDEYYISMECVEGGSLDDRIKSEGSIPLEETLRILLAMAKGMAHAHARESIHRDLKPANVLLGVNGAVKITDFGLARKTTPGMTITQVTDTVGTPAYMAPETFRTSRVTIHVDIYALGLIAYEMVTGKRFFPQDDIAKIIEAQMDMPVPVLATPGSGIPKTFETFVRICAKKEPSERYPSMDKAVASLERQMRKLGLIESDPTKQEPLWVRIVSRLLDIG